jgi:hypothetical protein
MKKKFKKPIENFLKALNLLNSILMNKPFSLQIAITNLEIKMKNKIYNLVSKFISLFIQYLSI